MIFMFIYNILLIVLYSVALTYTLNAFFQKKKKLYLLIVCYLAFFILDNSIIYMTEFINSFAERYNSSFTNTAFIKTFIFTANNYFALSIISIFCKKKISIFNYFIIMFMFVWMLYIPTYQTSAFKVWLYYSINQLFLFYLGCYCLKNRKNIISESNSEYLRVIGLVDILFSILIVLEDTFVIFKVDEYSSLSSKIYNRSISEDLFSITVCIMIIYYINSLEGKNEEININLHSNASGNFNDFCKEYQLTNREAEIFKKLLEKKSNQDIADELYLSLGTVKTHVHNIFIKLDVNKRMHCVSVYEKYQEDRKNDNI